MGSHSSDRKSGHSTVSNWPNREPSLLVALDVERHLALGDTNDTEAKKMQVLDNLNVGEELLVQGGLIGAGHRA